MTPDGSQSSRQRLSEPSAPMPSRLAIFDFDGTLADSFPFFVSVFNQIADQHGFRRIKAGEAQDLRHHDMRAIMRHVGMPAWKLPLASGSFIGLMRENARAGADCEFGVLRELLGIVGD